ncbi:hypothetical protein [Bacillus sp. RC250]|uniref:hypothetical protein n=1 Tax=Bacillus sp. RC250 TaxID=3156287 RepID=UPI0038343A24
MMEVESNEVSKIWIWLLVILISIMIMIYVHNLLENKGWVFIFWGVICVVITFGIQWISISTIYEYHKGPLWIIIFSVFLGISFSFAPMLSATVVLKTLTKNLDQSVYTWIFIFLILLMSIPPILYFKRKVKNSQNEAKDAYEVIKPIINSFTLLATIYIFTERYFNGGSTESMPGFISDLNTLPFYCYPWSFAITFVEYYIKKK